MNWCGLRDWLNELGTQDGVGFSISVLSELSFLVNGENTYIRDEEQSFDIKDFDLVVFRTMGRSNENKERAEAVAIYCRKKGVKCIDSRLPHVGGKLNSAYERWFNGLNVPKTAVGSVSSLVEIAGRFGYPVILKATDGKKGRDNYLVKTSQELTDIVAQNQDKQFVLNEFIPNDGDYRLLTLNYQVKMIILRQSDGRSHLNNTSVGGAATVVNEGDISQAVIDLAVAAAKTEGMEVAGVDVIIDKNTGTPYVLEVNRAPQVASGAFAEAKMGAYYRALKEMAEE
jgi:glutathione synthase/RimK-type ligase-like ATP-grasp enzyme